MIWRHGFRWEDRVRYAMGVTSLVGIEDMFLMQMLDHAELGDEGKARRKLQGITITQFPRDVAFHYKVRWFLWEWVTTYYEMYVARLYRVYVGDLNPTETRFERRQEAHQEQFWRGIGGKSGSVWRTVKEALRRE